MKCLFWKAAKKIIPVDSIHVLVQGVEVRGCTQAEGSYQPAISTVALQTNHQPLKTPTAHARAKAEK